MNDEPTTVLSPDGAARRDAMLAELLEHMSKVHRRRHRRRRAAAALGLLLAIAGIAWIQSSRPAPVGSTGTTHRAARNPDQSPAASPITVVATDTSVLARLRAEPAPLVRYINDDVLLTTLAEIERPAGLIVTFDAVRLSAAVTDHDLGLDHSPDVSGSG